MIFCTKRVKSVLLIGIIFNVIFAGSINQFAFSQNSSGLLISPIPTETVSIVSPITTQNVSAGQELTISGMSSDNNKKNCSVSVIVNNLRPYQPAIAKGSAGMNDYSQWEFGLRPNYTQIIEGENKITAKLVCQSASPRWYSVFINGVPNFSNSEALANAQSEGEQSTMSTNLPVTNNIEGNNETLSTLSPEEEQDVFTSEFSNSDGTGSDNNALVVSIVPLNDPVSRGDSQNVTITVTDSASTPVANAEIDGILIYPGDNFEKEFSGITDSQGEFVHSWIIGENGDVGPLSVQVEVSSQEHQPSSTTVSFDVIGLSEESD
ncbi:MAG: hypothetical protein ACM3ZS_02535 [Nitrososphaerota archaeon]